MTKVPVPVLPMMSRSATPETPVETVPDKLLSMTAVLETVGTPLVQLLAESHAPDAWKLVVEAWALNGKKHGANKRNRNLFRSHSVFFNKKYDFIPFSF